IVELSVVKVAPGPSGARETRTWLLNPGVPIPVETTAIHGITDEMVASAPSFADKAAEIFEFFKGCDLGGFGLSKLDIPILEEEFLRCGLHFDAAGRRMFDALRVYHKREPRDLSAALRFYCGEEPADAHGAEVDAVSALRVLEGEFAKYPDLPTDPDEFDKYLNGRDPSFVDREGRFRRGDDGEVVVNFGRKKGRRVRDLAVEEPSYLAWILHGDFPPEVRKVARDALQKWAPKKQAQHSAANNKPAANKPAANKPAKRREPPVPPQFSALAAGLAALYADNDKK
ncbi:MAG: 3'-5' exonuclease, partial [Kiritimatiellae bacterium]|nr:3'-5' exonuclease [Kiritimatiellia bacterium]